MGWGANELKKIDSRQHRATIRPSQPLTFTALWPAGPQPNLCTGGTTPAHCSCQLCRCTQGEGSRKRAEPAEYRLAWRRAKSRWAWDQGYGQNARLGRGASRGWTRPSYCLSLGSRRSLLIGKSLSCTMKQLRGLHSLQTRIHPPAHITSKQEEQQKKPTVDAQDRNVVQK